MPLAEEATTDGICATLKSPDGLWVRSADDAAALQRRKQSRQHEIRQLTKMVQKAKYRGSILQIKGALLELRDVIDVASTSSSSRTTWSVPMSA